MPLTYSIAYGLLAGIACWIFLQSLFKIMELIGFERPVFVDEDDESAFPSSDEKKQEGSSDEGVVIEKEPDAEKGNSEEAEQDAEA